MFFVSRWNSAESSGDVWSPRPEVPEASGAPPTSLCVYDPWWLVFCSKILRLLVGYAVLSLSFLGSFGMALWHLVWLCFFIMHFLIFTTPYHSFFVYLFFIFHSYSVSQWLAHSSLLMYLCGMFKVYLNQVSVLARQSNQFSLWQFTLKAQ